MPLCLWIASRHPNDFQEALWETVTAMGDIDTTCAIVAFDRFDGAAGIAGFD